MLQTKINEKLKSTSYCNEIEIDLSSMNLHTLFFQRNENAEIDIIHCNEVVHSTNRHTDRINVDPVEGQTLSCHVSWDTIP